MVSVLPCDMNMYVAMPTAPTRRAAATAAETTWRRSIMMLCLRVCCDDLKRPLACLKANNVGWCVGALKCEMQRMRKKILYHLKFEKGAYKTYKSSALIDG